MDEDRSALERLAPERLAERNTVNERFYDVGLAKIYFKNNNTIK